MRKFVTCLVLCVMTLSACAAKTEYIPPSGEYALVCKIGELEYNVDVLLNEDMSGKLTFSEDSALSDWYFTYSPEKTVKCFTSLGEESEVKGKYVKKIFEFILDDHELVSDVSHEKISGRDVSVLKLSGGGKIYTDSESGAPLKLVFDNLTADIISRPSALD